MPEQVKEHIHKERGARRQQETPATNKEPVRVIRIHREPQRIRPAWQCVYMPEQVRNR